MLTLRPKFNWNFTKLIFLLKNGLRERRGDCPPEAYFKHQVWMAWDGITDIDAQGGVRARQMVRNPVVTKNIDFCKIVIKL